MSNNHSKSATHSIFALAKNANITSNALSQDYNAVGAWFLGPKGENKNLLQTLIANSIAEHAQFRNDLYSDDPPYIDSNIQQSQGYTNACEAMEKARQALSEKLKQSVPFFSERYQAHMNWDTVIPGNVGYITAMLFNQNNVAGEGGPETCVLEKEVGAELCQLLGFDENSWGHITADGSIANLESMWMARNLKCYPLAVKEALLTYTQLSNAKSNLKVTVYEPEGLMNGKTVMALKNKLLVDCTNWQLLNLNGDEICNLPIEITQMCQLKQGEIDTYLTPFLLQNKGIAYYASKYPEVANLRVFVPATKHYSWPKAGTLLGLGQDNIVGIPVGDDCRMDMDCLKQELLNCAKANIPVLMTVAVIGSTEEGVVDNLERILEIREEAFSVNPDMKGMNFLIHCDAAWGGYLRTMMVPSEKSGADVNEDSGFVPYVPLSAYAQKQYSLLGKADTITIDPHKAGFIPYPAGSLCYKNGLMRYLITFNAAYIHSGTDLNIGVFGVEGSKPGAAPTAVWLAHQCIPLNSDGYGQILGECSFSTKLYYCYWLTLAEDNDDFRIETLIPLPDKIYNAQGTAIIAQGKDQILAYIRNNILWKTNEELVQNPDAIALLQQVGSDVLINSFVVNFRKNGQWNQNLDLLNQLNEKLFNKFSLVAPDPTTIGKIEYFLTMSELDTDHYKIALNRICQNLGIQTPSDEYSMNFLINTILQPWPTTHGFVKKIMDIFKQGIYDCISQLPEEKRTLACAQQSDDVVTAIPGDATSQPKIWYPLNNSYAGYADADASGVNKLFYWFFESRSGYTEQTPLIIWLNGGPGASSLAGLFLENGPFSMSNNSVITPNSASWNQEAHMLFWDQPVGTGYSNLDGVKYVQTEEEMATQFVNALQFFYNKHPEYRYSPLYITGESYAGKYIPYIALEITNRNDSSNELPISLKGIAIGDGWIYPELQTTDQINYAYMLGLVDTNQKQAAEAQYKKFYDDLHASPPDMKKAFADGTAVSDMLVNCGGGENIYDVRTWSDASIEPLRTYLSSSFVKRALNVPQNVVWSFCDAQGPVADNLINDMMASAAYTIPKLVDYKQSNGQPAYELLFYTGNFDMSCGFTGTEQILRGMEWSGASNWAQLNRKVWYQNDSQGNKQTLGCIKQYNNLTQIEIPMSGHQVPMYQPETSRQMIYNWILQKVFESYNPLEKQLEKI